VCEPQTNLPVDISVDEAELDHAISLLRTATSCSESQPFLSIKEKVREMERLDGIFRGIYDSAGIELHVHNAPARRTGNCTIVNHPTQRLLEVVAAMGALDGV
jgi:hypothetical protein